jgi:hypothetical protein
MGGMQTGSNFITLDAPIGEEQERAIRTMDNNALIIRLHFTVHHLSRWITPIHDRNILERSRYYGEPTVKEILIGMRDHEQFIYPRMYTIATGPQAIPDLDAIPEYEPTRAQQLADQEHATVEIMAGFRRLRQGTCSLLRELPDGAWEREGFSRQHKNSSLRQFAEELALHDYRYLRAMDQTLNEVGAREGIATIQRAPLEELLKLVPQSVQF